MDGGDRMADDTTKNKRNKRTWAGNALGGVGKKQNRSENVFQFHHTSGQWMVYYFHSISAVSRFDHKQTESDDQVSFSSSEFRPIDVGVYFSLGSNHLEWIRRRSFVKGDNKSKMKNKK